MNSYPVSRSLSRIIKFRIDCFLKIQLKKKYKVNYPLNCKILELILFCMSILYKKNKSILFIYKICFFSLKLN
jgi:hypothetical protein